jgi:prolyl-tRNA editing enzyme YbaK/EbsC (Cys-tRNA(Pro) deacylase)
VTARVERWLREAGVEFEICEHAPVRTSEEAARVRGTPLEAGAKALLVRADTRFVHCVLPAHLKAFNAGTKTVSIVMRYDDMVRLAEATVGRFASV